MSTPFRLLLPRQIYIAMIDQAQAELPNECCGMLAGRPAANGVAVVSEIYPLVNVAGKEGEAPAEREGEAPAEPIAAGSPTEFLSDGRSMFQADRARQRAGLEFLAVYHSHPTSAPVPSKKDLERNYCEDVMNFIISLKDGSPLVKGWWLTATDFHPAEWEITDHLTH